MPAVPDIISIDGLRHDSRMPNEARTLQFEFGIIPGSNGSLRMTCGGTVVIVGVFGPRPSNSAPPLAATGSRETVMLTCRSCSIGRPRGAPVHSAGRELGQFVVDALFPLIVIGTLERCEIAITIDVPSVDGDVRAAAVTAASVALAHASIGLRSMPIGTAVSLATATPIVDPDGTEASQLRIPLAPDGRAAGTVPHAVAVFPGGASSATTVSLVGGTCSPKQLTNMLRVASEVAAVWERQAAEALREVVTKDGQYVNLYT